MFISRPLSSPASFKSNQPNGWRSRCSGALSFLRSTSQRLTAPLLLVLFNNRPFTIEGIHYWQEDIRLRSAYYTAHTSNIPQPGNK